MGSESTRTTCGRCACRAVARDRRARPAIRACLQDRAACGAVSVLFSGPVAARATPTPLHANTATSCPPRRRTRVYGRHVSCAVPGLLVAVAGGRLASRPRSLAIRAAADADAAEVPAPSPRMYASYPIDDMMVSRVRCAGGSDMSGRLLPWLLLPPTSIRTVLGEA